jgi:hypothetical protein
MVQPMLLGITWYNILQSKEHGQMGLLMFSGISLGCGGQKKGVTCPSWQYQFTLPRRRPQESREGIPGLLLGKRLTTSTMNNSTWRAEIDFDFTQGFDKSLGF